MQLRNILLMFSCVLFALIFLSSCTKEYMITDLKSCNDGNARSCYSLGVFYHGVKQDYFKAASLYEKACNSGLARGCYSLGFLYAGGQGVKQSNFKAKKFFGKACDLKYRFGCEAYTMLNK